MILAGDLLGCPDGYETVEAAQRADADAIIAFSRARRLRSTSLMGTILVELIPIQNSFSPCMDDVLRSTI